MDMKKFINQLFCKHDYQIGRRVYSYYDVCGNKVVVYARHCKKCGRISHMKFTCDNRYI